MPVVSKRFADVAKLCIAEMNKQLESGVGKKVYADYIVCIERYLIPYFGAQYVTSIDYEKVQSFYEWRRAKMGREPKASRLNTQNSSMDRVFDEAVARVFLAHKNVPMLVNKGERSEQRPDFTREEYATMIRKLPHWIKHGKACTQLWRCGQESIDSSTQVWKRRMSVNLDCTAFSLAPRHFGMQLL